MYGIKYTLIVQRLYDYHTRCHFHLQYRNSAQVFALKKPARTRTPDAYELFAFQTKYRLPYFCQNFYAAPHFSRTTKSLAASHFSSTAKPHSRTLSTSEFHTRPPSLPALPPTGRKACRPRCRPSSRPRRQCKYPPCPCLPSVRW